MKKTAKKVAKKSTKHTKAQLVKELRKTVSKLSKTCPDAMVIKGEETDDCEIILPILKRQAFDLIKQLA